MKIKREAAESIKGLDPKAKAKIYQERFKKKHPARQLAATRRSKQWKEDNREEYLAYMKSYYQKNKERLKLMAAERRAKAKLVKSPKDTIGSIL